jgi:hypothetical protein
MRNSAWAYWLIALVLGAAVVFFIADLAGGRFEPDWRWASVVALGAMAIWIAPRFFAHYSGRPGPFLQNIAIWLGIALVFALIYAYRNELGLPFD